MYDFWDFLKFIGQVAILLAVLLALVFGSAIAVDRISQSYSCQQYSDMGIQVHYNFWTGCMARHSQFGWIPVDEYFKTLNLNVQQ